MAVWKMDLVFEARGRGWQESYYADWGVADFDGMAGYADKLATLRIAMSAFPVEIKAWRIQDPLITGRKGIARYFKPRKVAPDWQPTRGATEPSASVNVGMLNLATNKTRRIWVRGVPDDMITDYGELQGPQYAAWLGGPFAAWRACILGTGGAFADKPHVWLSRVPIADPMPVSYAYGPNAVVPVFTTPDPFFPAGDKNKDRYVRIRGLNGTKSPLNGAMVVRVLTETTFQPLKPIAAGPFKLDGLVQRYNPVIETVSINRVEVEKSGRRAPGRPLLVTPGRASPRARS